MLPLPPVLLQPARPRTYRPYRRTSPGIASPTNTLHRDPNPDSTTGGGSPWHQAIKDWGLPAPSANPLLAEGSTFPLVWKEHRVVAATEILSKETAKVLIDMAFDVIVVPVTPQQSRRRTCLQHWECLSERYFFTRRSCSGPWT